MTHILWNKSSSQARVRVAGIVLALGLTASLAAAQQPATRPSQSAGARSLRAAEQSGDDSLNWKTGAIWRHGLTRTSGTLALEAAGVRFIARGKASLHWSYVEVRSFKLIGRRLIFTGYENRKWRLPGDRSFHFELETAVPSAIAAKLAERVGKPVENGDPDPKARAWATLLARHRTRWGGTNGVLRFRQGGIDYVTPNGQGARSWRWSDIQTIARPDRYHFSVEGYLETFDFELKQPMSKRLFNRLWNRVYARDLSGLDIKEGKLR